MPRAWQIAAMSVSEKRVARKRIPQLHGRGRLLGDSQYDVSYLYDLAAKHGYTVSGTWGKLTGEAFRISHMGQSSSPEYLYPFLLGIEDFVRSVKEVDVPVGASLVGLAGLPPR